MLTSPLIHKKKTLQNWPQYIEPPISAQKYTSLFHCWEVKMEISLQQQLHSGCNGLSLFFFLSYLSSDRNLLVEILLK